MSGNKKQVAAAAAVDRNKRYSVAEAIRLVKETSTALKRKFDTTAADMAAAVRTIEGTAKSMGITVS